MGIIMIRKTKRNKGLVRKYHGQLEMAEFATYDDVLAKLHYYEELERKEAIMELSEAWWVKISYDDRCQCTHCGSITDVPQIDGKPGYKFCPYCNAKMLGRKWKI